MTNYAINFFWRARLPEKGRRSGYAGRITIAQNGRMLIRPYYPSRSLQGCQRGSLRWRNCKNQTKYGQGAPLRALRKI